MATKTRKGRPPRPAEYYYDAYLKEFSKRLDSIERRIGTEKFEELKEMRSTRQSKGLNSLEPMNKRDFEMAVNHIRGKYKATGKNGHLVRDIVTTQVYDYSQAQYNTYVRAETIRGVKADNPTLYRLFGSQSLADAIKQFTEDYKNNPEAYAETRAAAIRSLERKGKLDMKESTIRNYMISMVFFGSD